VIATRLHETKDMATLKHHMHFSFKDEDLKIIQSTLDMEVEDTRQVLIKLINFIRVRAGQQRDIRERMFSFMRMV